MSLKNIEDIYKLSPMQQGMLFHSLYAPETKAYFEQSSWKIRGELDVDAFERAWNAVVNRHSALRTAFVWEELDEPLQVVYRNVSLSIDRLDWQSWNPSKQEVGLLEVLESDREKGFNFSDPPLIRLTLVQTNPDTYIFVWSHHHILMDGWSQPIILKDVLIHYEIYQQKQDQRLPPARPYRDYIAWLQKQDVSSAQIYWQSILRGFIAPTPLPEEHLVDYDILTPARSGKSQSGDYDIYKYLVSQNLSNDLYNLVQKSQITLNTFIQGAWAILLNKYCGDQDVLFGATVSGRPADLPGAESIVGLFINTLPVRVRVDLDAAVIDWLIDLQKQQAISRQYDYVPLMEIQSWSEIPHDTPLFNSLLIFENYSMGTTVQEGQQAFSLEQGEMFTRTNYPLTIAFSPGRQIGIEVGYECDHFSEDSIKNILNHLIQLLESMTVAIEKPISSLSILSDDELNKLLVEWNKTERDYPADKCVHQLIEERATLSPAGVALETADAVITCEELNRRANQLANYIQSQGVKQGDLVGVLVDRSVEMIISILAVLKAGGAYVPLDPNYPQDRLRYMVVDSNLSILLTNSSLESRLPGGLNRHIFLDKESEKINQQSGKNLFLGTTLDDLAYVIYTSGSTGTPKGVAVTHRSLSNHALTLSDTIGSGPLDRILLFISLSFDAAAETIYPTLINGATLLIPPPGQDLLGANLIHYCQDKDVTILHLPVPIWHQVVDLLEAEGLAVPEKLRLLHVGGESIAIDKLQSWCKRAQERNTPEPMRLLNSYGPTEATITTTLFHLECTQDFIEGYKRIPIGRPIANVRVYVLDERLHLVPVGAAGELYIGGVALARGYLNNPQETANKFIADPFNSQISARLYKTGDMVRYLPDGNLEFLGRVDDQVKIRGFRVELGEIDTVIRSHKGVRNAVTIMREDNAGDKRLVSYIVTENSDIDIKQLRKHLQDRLPEYMVPAIYQLIEAIPLTPSGKLDRRALPEPESVQLDLGSKYMAPRTPVEQIVAGLFSQVLNIDRPGIRDNFFDLGGHSLKATQLLSRLRQTFDTDIELRLLFESPTVEGISEKITLRLDDKISGAIKPSIQPIPRDEKTGLPLEPPPLSYSQQRLWFLEQLDPGNLGWNIPIFVRIKGVLNPDALQMSLNAIVRRHEALRTCFDVVDGQPFQDIKEHLQIPLRVDNISGVAVEMDSGVEFDAAIQALCQQEVQQPFDFVEGPLIRAKLLRVDIDDHILIFTLHHIIADGWSLGILVRELTQYYQVYSSLSATETQKVEVLLDTEIGEPVEMSLMPELPIQYADFSVWQRNWLRGNILEDQLEYWRNQLKDLPAVLDLPTDFPRPALKTSTSASLRFQLPLELSTGIMDLTKREGITAYMLLLAAFQTLLYRYSGQVDIPIGTAVANRSRREIESLIGFFVNTLVMRGDLRGNPSFRELLKRTREVALEAYAHQDLPFEMLVEDLQPERNLSYTPLFQVGFDFQDTPVEAINLPEINLSPIEYDAGSTPYDLLLSVTHIHDPESNSEILGGTLEYTTDLYEKATIKRMLDHFEVLLWSLVRDPDQAISSIPILSPNELNQMLIEWNATEVVFPDGQTIHERFEYHANIQPDALAVTFEGKSLTYDLLNRKSNQLAHYLRKHGVGSDVIIGISVERSFEMVIGILGVLKAGGAYLPLDPTYPADRIAFMVEDSNIPLLLTQSHLIQHLPEVNSAISLDADWEKIALENQENPAPLTTEDNLAYVIYTSGSTGRPKGTLLRHRGLCNLVEAQRIAFDIERGKKILQFSPFSFDASVWETFMALANGATLSLARQEILSSGLDLVRLFQDEEITTVTLPPSMLGVLPQDQITSDALPNLETVIAAGEACTQELVSRWAPGRRFFNAYGPTETTVCASMKLCDENESGDPPIGRPIANTKLYIVDQNLQPVPIGVPGELLVGGISLARGYLRRPEMTAVKFIPDPFLKNGEKSSANDMRMVYRTGDLVRYRPNGDIEFLGRIDHQVKVRGHRIELAEIETALRTYVGPDGNQVREAVVIVREDKPGDKRLVAYMTVDSGDSDNTQETFDSSDLRGALRKTLPEYMLPSAFVMLEKMPLSPAGKVDRLGLAKLPPPEIGRKDLEVEFVAPRSPVEVELAGIVTDLLMVENSGEGSPIGVHDNFFDLGGHSLLATQFISRIRDTFKVELPLRTLFEHPTVAELAIEIEIMEKQEIQVPVEKIQRVSRSSRRVKKSELEEKDGS